MGTFGSRATNANHPEELVDVIRCISRETSKQNKEVVYIKLAHDLVRMILGGGHGLADSRNVGVVPSVVVHEGRAIRHG